MNRRITDPYVRWCGSWGLTALATRFYRLRLGSRPQRLHDLENHARIRVHGAVSTERTQQEGDEESAPGAVWQSGTHRIAEKVEGAKALQLTGKAAESGQPLCLSAKVCEDGS